MSRKKKPTRKKSRSIARQLPPNVTPALPRLSQLRPLTVAVSAYQQLYPGNPVLTVINQLAQEGKLSIEGGIDGQKIIADEICHRLSDLATINSGLGSMIINRVVIWLKGLQRSDVIR